MEELFIETNFGRVFGKAAGDLNASLVLGLHGWSQRNGWHTWEPMILPLAAAGLRVVSVDMPGWGRSVAVHQGPLSTESAVSAVLEILDGLGVETASLMGKSWGGAIALSLALAHRGRVSKLILTAPAFRHIEQLAALTQPVLLAWARDDPMIPYEYAAKYVANVPTIELQTYDTGGHSAAPKNADDFAPKAIEFLKS